MYFENSTYWRYHRLTECDETHCHNGAFAGGILCTILRINKSAQLHATSSSTISEAQ